MYGQVKAGEVQRVQAVTPSLKSEAGAGLRAEEDGFALEHFDGEEERSGRVNARGEENEGDVIPMIGASNELLAEKAGTEDRNEGEFGSELDTRKHGGDGRDDDHKH